MMSCGTKKSRNVNPAWGGQIGWRDTNVPPIVARGPYPVIAYLRELIDGIH
jgi:hypothetical protein